MRWFADVNVWTGRSARNGRAKREERYRVALQEIQQRLAFGTVGMKLNVHRVVMVQPPAIVNRALAEDGDRQLAMKRVGEEALHFPRLAEVPAGATGETNEGRSTHQPLLGEGEVFRELLTYMISDPKTIQVRLQLILVARHLERIADHATNICEDVVYLVEAKDIRHHAEEGKV